MSSILEKRLILIAGKGGVGRSTVAAAVAAAAARRGRRTLLFQSNANDRYSTFFGSQPVGADVVRLRENLYAINTNPAAALEEYGLMVLRFKRVYKLVFENKLTRYFLRAIPGLDDYAILGKAWYHSTEKNGGKDKWDTIVFDLPASGHSLSMLKIPQVIVETVPEGPLTRDARTLVALLRDKKRTAVVLTTLAEEMPANEAAELSQKLDEQVGLDVAHLVINQVYPDLFPVGSPQHTILERLSGAGPLDDDLTALATHSDLARRRRLLNERYIAQLATSVVAPRSMLPLLFSPELGPREIEELSQHLESALA